ncbi:MAG TPA: hypothetical protein VE890_10550 [Thermoguttaceae bacterium]|nr:hypothetical protein [Thermoguttaceae bacterium]
MGSALVCIAAALLGVDARWPPLPDGGLQYVIQIEPQVLKRLESGAIEAVGSEVPPTLDDIRAFQIVIGTQRSAMDAAALDTQTLILSADAEWITLPNGHVECRVWIQPEMLDEIDKLGHVIEGTVPAEVETLSLFTIAMGTKPPAESFPVVNEADLPGSVVDDATVADSAATETDRWPAGSANSPPATRPYLAEQLDSWPSLPRIDRSPAALPSTEAAPPVTSIEPSLPPTEAGTNSKPIALKPANYVQLMETPSKTPPEQADPNSPPKKEPAATDAGELPLSSTVTLLVLFASMGGNIFLLWVMRDFRNRYRSLVRRVGEDVASGVVVRENSTGN